MAKATNPKLRVTQQFVTPEMAMDWLGANTHNRPVRQNVVEKYARDMKAGDWMLTHQGILFDWNSVLLDGQHRLWAIVESGCTIEMMVTYDADPATQEHIDGGEIRQVRDIMALRGEKVAPLVVGINNMLAKQVLRRDSVTRQEQLTNYEEYRDAIDTVFKLFPRMVRGVTVASVIVPMVRASFSEAHPKLTRFAQVLSDGMGNGSEDRPVILLRNYLVQTAVKHKAKDIYGKTERALHAFLNNEQITNLFAADRELFPLPVEVEAERERRARTRSEAAKKAAKKRAAKKKTAA